VTVKLTKAESEGGYLSGETMRRLWILMRVCGVVSIEDVFHVQMLAEIAEQQDLDFDAFYQDEDHAGVERTESAGRSEGRFELKFPYRLPYTNPDFYANRIVLAFVKCILTSAVQIDTFSAVTSLPGAPLQHYHADVSNLFKNEDVFLLPQALVTVAPLVNLTKITGPTEYITGSHIQLSRRNSGENNNRGANWADRDFQPTTPRLSIQAKVGSVVIFDVRLRHRGGANHSDKKRPIVYMSYARDWYTDKVNYKEKQTSSFDALTPQQRKLLGRIDHNSYVSQLEALVEKHEPGTIESLQSSVGYKAVDLKA